MPKQKKYISDIPELMAEWDWEKNNELGLDPSKITRYSKQSAWWICKRGHHWRSRMYKKTKCPICSGKRVKKGLSDLKTTHPYIAKQWHPTKNENLQPTLVSHGSKTKVWWKCEVCGREWQATIASRCHSKHKGCASCLGISPNVKSKQLQSKNAKVKKRQDAKIPKYNLDLLYPSVSAEWDYTKNINIAPNQVTPGSGKKVWWKCAICGHEWLEMIRDRTRRENQGKNKIGCPICRKNKTQ